MRKLTVQVLVGLLLLPTLMSAQQKELKVLFVGNSYTYGNNLAHIVSIISEGTGTKLVTRKTVIGGAHLWEHWNGDRELETKEIIANGDFDIVVLQDYSMSGIDTPDSTLKYVKLFASYIEQNGAETYLFNTWARKKVPQYQVEIDELYTRAAIENDVVRVPVGPAWELAMDIRPTIGLFTSDGSHPTALGTLLTAYIFVKAITGELPDEIPLSFIVEDAAGETVRLMGADPLDSEFCKRITREIMGE
ncbi:MAG: hypothetical protein KAT15_01060 [Bacteroidales bacterium]|nr:hypothetical protein [Bacteroidales bacterium]